MIYGPVRLCNMAVRPVKMVCHGIPYHICGASCRMKSIIANDILDFCYKKKVFIVIFYYVKVRTATVDMHIFVGIRTGSMVTIH